ncbi:KN motif and ankyrin repeat domain-containing protein 1 [Oryzias melastigma]|uniref:KN motif and ankyrin repeat domain-containing protein 1 n=1 Tax=Oryzias melastigma TaxID=30732 RepID=A0A834FIU8_ORYME|nr:KN motif and ankyrin repeat domain-containing protein 1 [Oryzias melastigma]
MAQRSYTLRLCPGPNSEEGIPTHLGVDYNYQLDRFQQGITIKRLSLKRRPRVALSDAEKTVSSSQWHSVESLSSSSSDDSRLLGMSSSARGRPPLPPSHMSSQDSKVSKSEDPSPSRILSGSKPQSPARCSQSAVMEKTETPKLLNQDAVGLTPPQPLPRRRLASFGGVSSPGSVSPFTGLSAYNQNNNNHSSDADVHLGSSLSSRGSTGCLQLSPQSSGRSTPVSSPMHLQHVRDQMVVALQKLKELEEQVKMIPVLQVKISVLQEEKRQLYSQLKNQNDNENINNLIWNSSCDLEMTDIENEEGVDEELADPANSKEVRQLSEEMDALEKEIKEGHLQVWHSKGLISLQGKATKSISVGTDTDLVPSKSSKVNKSVHTDQVETRSIATEVSEVDLGIYAEQEAELIAQQLLNGALKERICHLEAELKESAFQIELTRLKLELHAAGARNRADKACLARPSTASISTETKPFTKNQGAGNHKEFRDASTGEVTGVKTLGISCKPMMKTVCIGPDVPMNHWEIRERVENKDAAVGIQIFTNTLGVGTEMKVRDAGSNTEIPSENIWSKKEKVKCHSVGCGDFSINDSCCEAKDMVSKYVTTDLVRGVDLGIMASPETASQRTNTVSNLVSRFTNTRQAFSNDSSTNTLLSTQDKHTNTMHTLTRTVSVGSRVREFTFTTEYRSIGVNTVNLYESISRDTPETVIKITRDSGVGFTSIYENFLVGLKTRNMASGPSHLPDPVKTRSIGVGDGRIQELTVSSSTPGHKTSTQSQRGHELNHYIEKLHWLLSEHGDLLTGVGVDHNISKTVQSGNPVSDDGKEKHKLCSEPTVNMDLQPKPLILEDDCKSTTEKPEICHRSNSEVKRMIQLLEQQASSTALQGACASWWFILFFGGKNSVQFVDILSPNLLDFQSTLVAPFKPVLGSGEVTFSGLAHCFFFVSLEININHVNQCLSCFNFRLESMLVDEQQERRENETFREFSLQGHQATKGKESFNKRLKDTKMHKQQRYKLNERMFSACQILKAHLSEATPLSNRELQECLHTISQEWFSVSSHMSASPDTVDKYLSMFEVISTAVLEHIANMADCSGNTALHYSVSHSNFKVVKKLLDAGVCNVNLQNAAGYTPIMLAALSTVENPDHMRVAGQTALMLAVSHGRRDMVEALLAQGADVNIRDDEGSTALMCASEHGHADIVKLLLAQPECDATLSDSDESTALAIALEAGHSDIAVLLYAHTTFSRPTGAGARRSGRFFSSSGGRKSSRELNDGPQQQQGVRRHEHVSWWLEIKETDKVQVFSYQRRGIKDLLRREARLFFEGFVSGPAPSPSAVYAY